MPLFDNQAIGKILQQAAQGVREVHAEKNRLLQEVERSREAIRRRKAEIESQQRAAEFRERAIQVQEEQLQLAQQKFDEDAEQREATTRLTTARADSLERQAALGGGSSGRRAATPTDLNRIRERAVSVDMARLVDNVANTIPGLDQVGTIKSPEHLDGLIASKKQLLASLDPQIQPDHKGPAIELSNEIDALESFRRTTTYQNFTKQLTVEGPSRRSLDAAARQEALGLNYQAAVKLTSNQIIRPFDFSPRFEETKVEQAWSAITENGDAGPMASMILETLKGPPTPQDEQRIRKAFDARFGGAGPKEIAKAQRVLTDLYRRLRATNPDIIKKQALSAFAKEE